MSKCDDGLMHIGKLAKEAGTTTRTVRYYEEMGLICPECRSSGGFRCYSHEQLARLRMILSLKEMEFANSRMIFSKISMVVFVKLKNRLNTTSIYAKH